MSQNKIIALVDGSVYSRSVCEHTGWAADKLGSRVEILHVLGRRQADTSDRSGAIALGARTALLDKLSALDAERGKLLQEQARAILADAKEIVSTSVDEVETRLYNGDLIEIIRDQEKEASLLVIGKRGEAADFATLHLGSNLERIIRASIRPVLVASRAYKPVEKVLIAWDGGTSSQKAVDYAARSPLFAGASVDLVFCGQRTGEIEKGLENARAMLSGAGLRSQTIVLDGQPDKVLGDFTAANGYGLVIMGAYGHTRIRSLIIGSTTTEMIRSCMVPILLMR